MQAPSVGAGTPVGTSSAARTPVGTSIHSTKSTRTSTGSSDPASLDKDGFMTLLLAQMRSQDPLQPQDNSQSMAQLAQFNALDQLITLNKAITTLVGAQQATEANGLIGRTITATGDKPGETITGEVASVTIEKSGPVLHVNGTTVPLDRVTAVSGAALNAPSAVTNAAAAAAYGR
jgi:flagellar basal-body rod modification protein FlgD